MMSTVHTHVKSTYASIKTQWRDQLWHFRVKNCKIRYLIHIQQSHQSILAWLTSRKHGEQESILKLANASKGTRNAFLVKLEHFQSLSIPAESPCHLQDKSPSGPSMAYPKWMQEARQTLQSLDSVFKHQGIKELSHLPSQDRFGMYRAQETRLSSQMSEKVSFDQKRVSGQKEVYAKKGAYQQVNHIMEIITMYQVHQWHT